MDGLRAAAAHGGGVGSAAAGAGDGVPVRHGRAGVGAAVFYRGGGAAGQSGRGAQGQDPHHPHPAQAVKEAAGVCQGGGAQVRRGVSHADGAGAFAAAALV